MLHHAGTLAIGYGTLGYVLRKLVQSQQKRNTQETVEKLRAFSAARNPTLSIDPYLNDTAQEKELESIGLPELPVLKAAEEDNSDLFAREFGGTHDPAHLALAAAAAIASSYGGWRLADYSADRDRGEELDTHVSETKNMIDKMVFEEIKRTRGPQKAAALTAVCNLLEKESQGMAVDDMRGRTKGSDYDNHASGNTDSGGAAGQGMLDVVLNPFRAIETGWWLWAAATFALSYAAAKRFGDNVDPNRKRLKEIEDIADERAKVYEAPVLLDESSFPPATASAGSAWSPNSRSTAGVPVQGVKTKTPVDATDPYASILQ